MFQKRKKTRVIRVGEIPIGGDNPIVIQSMTNTKTKDEEKTLKQIKALKLAGSEIVRVAVLDENDAKALSFLCKESPVPLIADIHFDHRLALKALESGIKGLRLNPGNIREKDKISLIVKKASEKNVPIRIGVNAGSLDPQRFPTPNAENMVLSALEHIQILEDLNFSDIKVSLKASDIALMIKANELFSKKRNYPVHLGVTEAGTELMSAVRSSIGIGTLLFQGIGDTLRVSVSGDPLKEIPIAREILLSLKLLKGIQWIGCPTCGRTEIDVEKLISYLEPRFRNIKSPLRIAVMGCVVNGPGEAREADIALVGGVKESLIYQKGEIFKKVPNDQIEKSLEEVILSFIEKV